MQKMILVAIVLYAIQVVVVGVYYLAYLKGLVPSNLDQKSRSILVGIWLGLTLITAGSIVISLIIWPPPI